MEKIKHFLKNNFYNLKYKVLILIPILILLLIIDWGSKAWAVNNLVLNGEQTDSFIPWFVNLKLIINYGSAYGTNDGNLALTVTLATLITSFVIILFVFLNDKFLLVGIMLILAGSLGNLIARAWSPADGRGPGGVVDFLVFNFNLFGASNFVFNIADGFVTFGIITLISYFVFYIIDYIIEIYWKSKNVKVFELRNQYKLQKNEIKLQEEKKWISSKFIDKFKIDKETKILLKANRKDYLVEKSKLIIVENKEENNEKSGD